MKIEVAFVKSAAAAADFPADRLPEVALVGRSNVGKSSLINALVRQIVARTSAAPGKTQLANIYRVARGMADPLYLVDLPGYGYARGGSGTAREFEALTHGYFERIRLKADTTPNTDRGTRGIRRGPLQPDRDIAALLLVDSRHPGLESDVRAWRWLKDTGLEAAIVATKIDKLARGRRIRAMGELESAFDDPVLPCSAVTGEGLDKLWKLIDRLVNSRKPPRSRNSRPTQHTPEETAPRPPRK